MNKNSEAILIFCSHLCSDSSIIPLEPREWSELASQLVTRGFEPQDLIEFSKQDFIEKLAFDASKAERFARLLDRSGSLCFEISKYENMGIFPLTRADKNYPRALKYKLGNQCPPLFYCAGDTSLLNKSTVGYVGSRTAQQEDIHFTNITVAKTMSQGYGVVTGGAKGIDTVSAEAALGGGGFVIEYLADSMMQKMKKSSLVKEIADGRLLLLSVAAPMAGFNVGIAMMRNKYIYAQSDATVVIRSEKGKGGTWAGATENLKKGWCTEYCRQSACDGNLELIKLGAIAIDENWDGEIVKTQFDPSKATPIAKSDDLNSNIQISLFD